MGNVPLQGAVAKLQFIPRNPIRTKAQLRHREHKQLDTPGFAVHDKLLALSKSMGHRQIESTLAYYSLTPAISDIMACTDNEISQQLTQDDYEKKINPQAMQIAACLHDWLEHHVPSHPRRAADIP